MRIAALCNSLFGLPSLHGLAERGILVGLGVPALQHEATVRVQQLAQQRGLPFAAVPESGAGAALTGWLHETKPDALLVLSFPYRLGAAVLAVPPLGVWNTHASPLPRHRGPDPIYWQVRAGVRESAVTVHRMAERLDTGPIAWAEPFAIETDDNHGLASSRAALAAAAATRQLVNLLGEHGAGIPLHHQDEAEASTDPRPAAEHLCIDWTRQSAEEVKASVQAANPAHGGAVAFLRGAALRVYEVSAARGVAPGPPGSLEFDSGSGALRAACADGSRVGIEVVYTDDGVFGGARFARLCGLRSGESFDAPPGGGAA